MNELKKIRAGVIGVGHLGQHHARLYEKLPDVELVWVVDQDQTRAEEIAKRYNAKWTSNYKEIYQDIDCVSIVVPTISHFEVASFFLERKVHCLVEKPVTETEEQAVELERIVKDSSVVLQVGHIERFNPAWIAVREKIVNPKFLEIHRLAPYKGRAMDVGVVLDLMIHDIDIVLHIVNKKIVDIRSSGVAVIGSHEDIVSSRIEFEGGCAANLTASRISQKEMRKIRIFQPHCYLALDYKAQTGCYYEVNGVNIQESEIETIPGEPLKVELEDFINCVRESKAPQVSIQHGREALSAALQIIQQIKN